MIRREWILAVVFGALWVLGLGAYPLLESTEGRYGSVATTMVRTGDWLEPNYDGAPLFTKPPLAYWTGAVAISLRPASETALRLVSSLWWLLAAWISLRLALAAGLSPRAARWAGIFTALSPLAVAQGHMNTGDIHLWVGVLLVQLGWLESRWPTRRRAVLVGSGWALGFLAKGHMVLFWTLLPALGTGLWLRRRGPRWRQSLGHPLAWVLFLALAAPWFVVVTGRHPSLIGYWLGSETVARVASTAHGRAEPWWYFLPQVPLLLLPWWPELARGLRRGGGDPVHRTFWAIWILLPLLIFSLSGSKRPNYLLPMIVPLALFAASGIERGRSWGRPLRTGVWAAIVLAFPFVLARTDLAPPTRTLVRRASLEPAPLVCFDVDPSSLTFYRGEPAPIYDRDPHNPFAPRRDAETETAELRAWVERGAIFLVRDRDVPRLSARTETGFETLLEARGLRLVRPLAPAVVDSL